MTPVILATFYLSPPIIPFTEPTVANIAYWKLHISASRSFWLPQRTVVVTQVFARSWHNESVRYQLNELMLHPDNCLVSGVILAVEAKH